MHHQHTPRPPLGLLIALALLLLVPIVGAGVWFWLQWDALQAGYPLLADTLRIALFAAPIALAIYGAAVGIQIAWRRWGWGESIAAHYAAELSKAQRQLPDSVTNLSYSYHDSHKALPPPAGELVSAAPVPSVPTFAELLDQGLIGPGRPLILGFNAETGKPIAGAWTDLYSCGVGALQGAGKSWLVAFLLAQSAAAGGRLIICDPHAGAEESLTNRIAALAPAFMCNVATTDDEILQALRFADDKLHRRIAGQAGQWPIVVAVDEWSSLLRGRLGAELPALITNIAEQGRKYGVNGLLSAQGWTKDAAGIVRNRLTSHYVMRQKQDEARYQLGLPATRIPDDVRLLPDACGYFLNVRGDLVRVVIPKMDATSMARAGALIDGQGISGRPLGFQLPTAPLPAITAEINGKPSGNQVEATEKLISSTPQRAKTISPEAARAAALFCDGRDIPEIIRELRGEVKGRAYQAASAEVHQLIREGLDR